MENYQETTGLNEDAVINAAFQEMGIEELRMPKTKEERRAEIEARRAAREASKQKGK